MNPTATVPEKLRSNGDRRVTTAADGDAGALSDLLGRHLDDVHAVVRFLGDDESSRERTIEVATTAAATGSWSRDDELVSRLYAGAAGTTEGVDPDRRALALVDLAGRSLSDAAADLGVGKAELRGMLYRARTAIRRDREPLAGGGRCLRARWLLSQSLDEGLSDRDAELLRVHLDNCPRCIRHDEQLAAELEHVHERFRQPAPAELHSMLGRALGASEPVAVTPAAIYSPKREPEKPASAPAAVAPPPPPAPEPERHPAPASAGRWRGLLMSGGGGRSKTFVALVIVIAVIAGLTAGVAIAINNFDSAPTNPSDQAPWSTTGAPQSQPAPIESQ